ncbi:hypothetical protein QAD02_001081 [Eretmocerus hayati]|uniref:Uncharacterized protein n=1 Tax=Eretmocerus hayati TaxID=131215 RepID=A0ACC2NHV2_9HYME|nr:hypothetical protein QAD02_001081 [Eretmocerus hayati]
MDGKLLILNILFGVLCLYGLQAEPLTGEKVEKISRSASFKQVVSISHIKKKTGRGDTQICSGILISPQHVLTTERCLLNEDLGGLVVYIGSASLRGSKPYYLCGRISYSQQNVEETVNRALNYEIHDIAVVQLCEVVDMSVRGPHLSKSTITDLEGKQAIMIGWGKTDDDNLKYYKTRATVTVLPKEVCQLITNWRSFDTDRLICTFADPHVLATPRDYGGPLFVSHSNSLAGLTTGIYEKSGVYSPGVNIHANLTFYKDFIHQFSIP